jgi:hypothetical protein
MDYKLLDKIPLAEAQVEAIRVKDHVTQIADVFCETCEDEEVPAMKNLLEDVQYNIMKIAIEKEFNK